jgi:MinD superfamily P-loop ATPase
MKEIVVISGKGGTGKTSITASFAALNNGNCVVADCDVDAADLHLILNPKIAQTTAFKSGYSASIRRIDCTQCGKCAKLCRYDAIHINEWGHYSVDPVVCEGCGVCVRFCPVNAVDFNEAVCGEWFVSETRFGAMVHARLGVAAENSGKLVTVVRNEAQKIALALNAEFLLIDGSPGVGCPVIASLTGADIAVIVTEPTVSGIHDLKRIVQLTQQFTIPAVVCVNKWDINPKVTDQIRNFVRLAGVTFGGTVCYDKLITTAQRAKKAVTEYDTCKAAHDIRLVWDTVLNIVVRQS